MSVVTNVVIPAATAVGAAALTCAYMEVRGPGISAKGCVRALTTTPIPVYMVSAPAPVAPAAPAPMQVQAKV